MVTTLDTADVLLFLFTVVLPAVLVLAALYWIIRTAVLSALRTHSASVEHADHRSEQAPRA
jgi:hypothetical protein